MYTQKRKQKTLVDKQFQDDIKEVKNLLGEAKTIIDNAEDSESYEKALGILNKAIMKASSVQVSNSYHLYFYRGTCYLNLNNFDKAERDFVESISLADEKGKIQIYNSLGKCKISMSVDDPSYLQQAIKCYQKSLQYSKNTDGDAFLMLAIIYRKQKNNNQAIKNYTYSLKFLKPAQQYQAYTQRGLCYRENGDVASSIQDFLQACKIKDDEPSCYFNLGVNYLLSQNYENALQKFQSAIEHQPNQPQYRNYKGLALYMSGQYQSCLHAYESAIKLYQDKNSSSAEVGECWYNLGNGLFHLNKQDQALIAYEMGLNYEVTEQQKLKIYYAQGLTYQSKKKPQAINKFKQCLNIISDRKSNDLYLSTLYHLAINQHRHKIYGEAVKNIDRMVSDGCNQKCVYQLRGRIYLDDQKYEKALKDFETLMGMNPSYPEVYYYMGMCKANLGDIDGAIINFFQSIDLGSRNTNLMNGLSYAYLKAGKVEKSLVYVNLALEKQPNNEDYLIQRSMAFIQLKQNNKGIQDLTKALTINNKNPLTYYRRGISYYKNKQFTQAIQDLKQSLNYQPSQQIKHDIHYLIGVSYANREMFELAIQPFTQAIKLSKVPRYYHERAKCYILTQKNSQALQDLNEVINMQPNNAFAYFRRALAYKSLKMYQQAAENFTKARQLSPEDPKLIVNKKQIYEIKFRKLCEAGEEE